MFRLATPACQPSARAEAERSSAAAKNSAGSAQTRFFVIRSSASLKIIEHGVGAGIDGFHPPHGQPLVHDETIELGKEQRRAAGADHQRVVADFQRADL